MLRAHAPVRLPGSQLEFREVRNRIREVGNRTHALIENRVFSIRAWSQ